MAPKNSEKWLQNKCIAWLKSQPNMWHLKTVGGAVQEAGVPDLLICKEGRFVAIELKRPKGTKQLSHIQRAQLERIGEAGGIALVIDNFDNFVKVMERV